MLPCGLRRSSGLLEGAALARQIGRAYLEANCLARFGFASKLPGFALASQRCEEAIAFAERHRWGNDRVVASAMATLGGTLIWTGEFAVAERWLECATRVGHADPEPGTRLLVHLATGMLHVSRGRLGAAGARMRRGPQGQAPVIHGFTRVESHLLAAQAHSELGDQREANASVERALELAERDRLIFPFVMTGSVDLRKALPRYETAHAALPVDILDVVQGSFAQVRDRPIVPPLQELTGTGLRVLRFPPTNLSRSEIARELCRTVNIVNVSHGKIPYLTRQPPRTPSTAACRPTLTRPG